MFDTSVTAFLHWLLRATLQGSLLVCLILFIKAVFRGRLPARWHYCLWLILLVRLSLPWAPQSGLSIYGLIPQSLPSHRATLDPAGATRSGSPDASAGAPARASGVGRVTAVPPGNAVQQEQGEVAASGQGVATLSSSDLPATGRRSDVVVQFIGAVLPGLWLAGAAGLAGYILIKAFRLWRAVSPERPVTDQAILELLEDCKMQMRVRTLVGVVVTDKVRTPALFGFLRPRILLPQGLIETLGLDGLHHVFLHELAHLKRRDIYLAWLVCLLQVLHWFNPLIWFAFRRMRADQEMAADALALAAAGAEESRSYGQTIVNLLERFSRPQYLPSLAGILENRSHIERRIQMIAQFKGTTCRPLLAMVLLAFLGLITLTEAHNKPVLQPEGKINPTAIKEAFVAPQASGAGENEKAGLAAESDAFIDPKTGIRFRKVKGFVGPNDAVEAVWGWELRPSPNGKFLLASGPTIIPLDGGKPFKLLDLPSGPYEGYWSPDGKKVALCGGQWPAGAIWVVRVDPDTAQPTGPAKRLVEGRLLVHRWLPDSERILFNRHENRPGEPVRTVPIAESVWTVSTNDGTLTQITDFSSIGIPSPDGENVAYSEDPTMGGRERTWVKSSKGGPRKKIDDEGAPDTWSADGKWVHRRGSGTFIRVADGYKVDIDLPAEVGRPLPPSSLDGRKMYSYRSSYENVYPLKVVSVSGGAPCELGIGMNLEPTNHFWCPDSQAIIVGGRRRGSDTNLWALPLNGGEPIPFKTDVPVGGGNHLFSFSPDRKSLLITTYKALDPDTGRVVHDVSVVPVSWQEMRTMGPAVLIFKEWHCGNFLYQPYGNVWSPDGKKVALADLGSIHVIPATGGDGAQVVRVPNVIDWLNWSPDGKMIAFHQTKSEAIEAVSSAGGEPRIICSRAPEIGVLGDLCWSPDSRAILVAARGDEAIRSVSIADGSTRSLVNLKDLGVDAVGLQFSPDGKLLAFGDPDGPLFLWHVESGKVDKLPGRPLHICWSPDGKWLSHIDGQDVKVRPESILWEMDVEEALAKLAK